MFFFAPIIIFIADVISHPAEDKYRRVNLGGKAGAKLVAVPDLVAFLVSAGFVETGDGHLELPASANLESLGEALGLLRQAAASVPAALNHPTAGVADPTVGMSLKQKAVWMAEQKAKLERENAKKIRAQELAKLEQDKIVRQTDSNWAPAAAGVKGGKDIDTFRGKYGEDKGG